MTTTIIILAIIGAITVLRWAVKLRREMHNLSGGPSLMSGGAGIGVRVVSGSKRGRKVQ